MNNKEKTNQCSGLPNETNVHKVFVFILNKLDLIYSSLSNDQTLKQKHKFMLNNDEQSLFLEIQKLLDKLIKLSKKQTKEQKPHLNLDYTNDIMNSNLAKSHFIENTVNLDDPNEPNTNSLQNHNFMQSVFDNKNRNHYHFPNEQLPSVVQSEQKQNCALHKQTSTMFLANKEITALLEFGFSQSYPPYAWSSTVLVKLNAHLFLLS